jgi:hypothetical protein
MTLVPCRKFCKNDSKWQANFIASNELIQQPSNFAMFICLLRFAFAQTDHPAQSV